MPTGVPLPIQFPDELLLLVFEEAVRHYSKSDHQRDMKFLALISQVSRRWFNVAMTPSLWTTIFITPGTLEESRVCLERSRHCPLNITIDYGFSCSIQDGDSDESPLLVAMPYIKRWRELHIFARRQPMRTILRALTSVYAPNLLHLHLAHCEWDFSPLDTYSLQDIFLGGTPALQSLRIFGSLPVTGRSFAIHSLETLEIVRALDHPLEWDQFHSFAIAPPNITHLTLSTGRAGLIPGKPYPIIEIPTLRSLRLDFLSDDHPSRLCAILSTPYLESLELSWISDWDAFINSLAIESPKYPEVKSLTLRMIHETISCVDFRFFGSFPRVSEFTLEDVDVEPFCDALQTEWVHTLTGETRVPWPDLHILSWKDIPCGDASEYWLQDLISTRRDMGFPLAVINAPKMCMGQAYSKGMHEVDILVDLTDDWDSLDKDDREHRSCIEDQ